MKYIEAFNQSNNGWRCMTAQPYQHTCLIEAIKGARQNKITWPPNKQGVMQQSHDSIPTQTLIWIHPEDR